MDDELGYTASNMIWINEKINVLHLIRLLKLFWLAISYPDMRDIFVCHGCKPAWLHIAALWDRMHTERDSTRND